jgi:alkylhydroperoxidase family enzyme
VAQQGASEELYAHVAEYRSWRGYTDRERLAIEFADRFVVDHTNMDDEFFVRLRTHFADDEIVDLGLCVAIFMGLGRFLRVLGIDEACPWDG